MGSEENSAVITREPRAPKEDLCEEGSKGRQRGELCVGEEYQRKTKGRPVCRRTIPKEDKGRTCVGRVPKEESLSKVSVKSL